VSKKRKWIIGIVVALALVIGVPAALFMSAFIGNAPLEDGKALGPAREVKISFVSAYVLDAGDGSLALIDAGADAKGEALLAAISGMGKKPDDVRAIFFTHGHSDHTAAAPVFPKADIYALEAERAIVEGTSVGHSPLANVRSPKPTGIHITKPLKDGDAVTIGKLTVHKFPLDLQGHRKEEEHHQPVIHPVAQILLYREDFHIECDDGLPQIEVGALPWRIGPNDRGQSGQEQDGRAQSLRVNECLRGQDYLASDVGPLGLDSNGTSAAWWDAHVGSPPRRGRGTRTAVMYPR